MVLNAALSACGKSGLFSAALDVLHRRFPDAGAVPDTITFNAAIHACAAYRPPDTNINLSGSYNQGRTNLQISMVPDEGAALLGPNGFTNGVGPANLGLSFNINM